LTTVDAVVLTVWFHIDQEFCYPTVDTGTFALGPVLMTQDGTTASPITSMEIDNGYYEFTAPQPNIDLSTTDKAYNPVTNTITECCVSHTFDIEVDLTNVTSVYGFSFTMTWDANLLETDAQMITFKAAFPPPYETLSVVIGTGTLTITLLRPCEKPTVEADPILPAVDIVFHSIDAYYTPPTNLPVNETTSITITSADICVKCPNAITEYDYGFGNGLLLNSGPILYAFTPDWIPTECKGVYGSADLNLDCVVDVQDLMVLLPYYDLYYPGGFGDIAGNCVTGGIVDIYDFVAIAKNFGPVNCPLE
jgi:hypothetical protein